MRPHSVFPVHVPSLRERREDIPLLTKYFVERYANTTGKRIRTIKNSTLQAFQSYHWPGNIRELQNVIERAVIWCDSETFSFDENWIQFGPASAAPRRAVALAATLANHEKEIIEAALQESRGRISGPLGAAVKLGIPRSTLESRIKTLHINKHNCKLKTYEVAGNYA